MKYKAKILPLSTGRQAIVAMTLQDTVEHDWHPGTRLKISAGKTSIIATLDNDTRLLGRGSIGLFSESAKKLGVKDKAVLHVEEVQKPESVWLIKKKLSGKKLTGEELYSIVKDITDDKLTEVELTYFVAGCYAWGLSLDETYHLTQAIVKTGSQLHLNEPIILDKHCIGGVPGNRTTLIVVPIIAAFGLPIPKTSSRSITSPAGTADTMEVLCNVELSLERITQVIKKTNGCMVWGGTLNLAPADDKIIVVEHPLSIDARGMLLSSVLAKKKSVGATHLLIDIPYGEGAKIESKSDAKALRRYFLIMGRRLGMRMNVLLTDGSQPIGNGIGPYLEAMDVLKVLKNDTDAPRDLKEKCILLAGELLNLSGKTTNGFTVARNLLESGKAYLKFMEIVAEQGKRTLPKPASHHHDVLAWTTGKVVRIDNKDIAKIALLAGAPQTKQAGCYLHKKKGEFVRQGEKLLTIYANAKAPLEYASTHFIKNRTYAIRP
ncbi:MAG: AMP phosphorylase [archaeon]